MSIVKQILDGSYKPDNSGFFSGTSRFREFLNQPSNVIGTSNGTQSIWNTLHTLFGNQQQSKAISGGVSTPVTANTNCNNNYSNHSALNYGFGPGSNYGYRENSFSDYLRNYKNDDYDF